MGHGITSTDEVFSVRQAMWHNLGHVLSEYPTRDEVQSLVFPWEPVATPIYFDDIQIGDDGSLNTVKVDVEGQVLQRRSDNGQQIAVTSDTYMPVLNATLLDVAEAIQDVPAGDVMYETGGTLEGGKLVWLMLRLAEPLEIKGDPRGTVIPHYLLQNNHAAAGAFKGSAVQERVVCRNTLRGADLEAKARGTEFTFHHTKNIGDRIEEAKQALAGWRESVEDFKAMAEHMVSLTVNPEGEADFIDRFIPIPRNATARARNNAEVARQQWEECYRSVTCEGITGTAWGLLQASSEWSEHIRRAKGDIDAQHQARFKRATMRRNEVITAAKAFALDAATI